MIELQDIPFALDADLLLEQQRIRPGTDTAKVFADIVARVEETARPKAIYDVAYLEEKAEDSVVVKGVRFTSRTLRRNLDPVERVFPYVATCGTEADAIPAAQGDLRQQVWLWSLKELLLAAAIEHLSEHLVERYRIAHYAKMNPGSGDAGVWPIEQQRELFSVLGDVEGRIGVKLTESMLMIPTMSVSGIIFPTETHFESCQICHREDCPRRKAPFSEEVWQAVCAD
jgi:hypothetical protein